MEGKLRLMRAICTWDLFHNSLVLILGLHSAWTWVKEHKSTQPDVCHILPNRIEEVNESDPCSNVHYLSSSENKAWKKIQACMGFEPMTSAILVQRSTNWANKLTGSWSLCWFQINQWSDEGMAKNIWKSYIWTADKDVNKSDPRSNVHYLSNSENKAWKNIFLAVQDWRGLRNFESCPRFFNETPKHVRYKKVWINVIIWATMHLPLPWLNNSHMITSYWGLTLD